jgi:hypothetical protein
MTLVYGMLVRRHDWMVDRPSLQAIAGANERIALAGGGQFFWVAVLLSSARLAIGSFFSTRKRESEHSAYF